MQQHPPWTIPRKLSRRNKITAITRRCCGASAVFSLSRGRFTLTATPCPCLDSSLIVVYRNCGQKHGSLYFRADPAVPMSAIIQPEPITKSAGVFYKRSTPLAAPFAFPFHFYVLFSTDRSISRLNLQVCVNFLFFQFPIIVLYCVYGFINININLFLYIIKVKTYMYIVHVMRNFLNYTL